MKKVILILLAGLLIACQTTQSNVPQNKIKAPQGVIYEGGDGSSYVEAVVIKASDSFTGIRAEYQWLEQKYPGYKRGQQTLINHNGQEYDLQEITTAKGEKKTVYFNVSNFYGKLN